MPLRRPALLLAAAAVLASCASCASGGATAPGAVALVGHVRTVSNPTGSGERTSRSEQAFALDLLRHLHGSDVAASPASLAVTLAMLHDGTGATTRSQLETVLGDPGGRDLDAGWRQLLAGWNSDARRSRIGLDSADAVWTQRGVPIEQRYLDLLRSYYGASVWQADFAHHSTTALAAIDRWTALHTRGRITRLFDRLDPETVLVLADAVRFDAAWADPFDAHDTRSGRFTTDAGRYVTARFMHSQSTLRAAVTGSYETVQLPYRGGRFAATAIMPTRGTLAEFVAGLRPDRLDAITTGLRAQPVALALPRFRVRSTLSLGDTLAAMGMPQAFTDSADFSAMTTRSVQVGQVVQRVDLAVGEKGTRAEAATGVDVVASSAHIRPPMSVTLDRPFLFLVRDTRTEAILFAATVANPAGQ